MSHFTVAVIHHKNQDIEELLAPYNENLEVERYIYKTKEQIIQEAYDKADNIRYRVKHGDTDDMVFPYDNNFLEAFTDEEMYRVALAYEGIDADGDSDRLDADGNWTSTYNPKSKWDWYSIGGRWGGMLKMPRDKVPAEWLEYMKDNDEYWETDSAPIGCIDFSPDKDVYDEHYKWWVENVDDPDAEWNEFYRKEYYASYYKNAEDYATRCAQFSTFAVVTPDGVWHERGRMGWFACVDDTPEDSADWDANYHKFIEEAEPEDIMTIVDCHI